MSMKDPRLTNYDDIAYQTEHFKSIFTQLEQDISVLEQAYSELKTLSSFSCLPQLGSSLLKAHHLIQEAQANQAPLKLLLLGGTGVGKSSLINHLANQMISSTSHSIRAHTQNFVVHLHNDWKQQVNHKSLNDIWPEELQDITIFSYHQTETLKTLWLIDAPDIDSVITKHPQRVQKALIEVDLPLWVSSPENYRDHVNSEFLNLIDQKRSLLAILNKVDRLTLEEQDEILEDAQSFVDELGFKNTCWFMTACINPKLSHPPQDHNSSSHDQGAAIEHELNKLKTYLEQHFDHKESTRLKGLRLVQRLQETYELLDQPLQAIAISQTKEMWCSKMYTKLTPMFRVALSLGIQKRLNSLLQKLYNTYNFSSIEVQQDALITTKLWSVYAEFAQFFPKSLANDYYEAVMRLRVEDIRLRSNSNSIIDFSLDSGFTNLSESSLEETVLLAMDRFNPALGSFQQKLIQLVQNVLLNTLIKLFVGLILLLGFTFWLNTSVDLLFASVFLSLSSIVIILNTMHLFSCIQQECQIFINQQQREFTIQSQNSLETFLRQDPQFATEMDEAKILVQYKNSEDMSKMDYKSTTDLTLANQDQKRFMLKVYKESLHSLQKYIYALSTSY
ncbi:MAG: hypothetical protein CMH49_07185 [Myxococcales bacterium]|nr:hypothetical protein [Myxococcales bacterium]